MPTEEPSSGARSGFVAIGPGRGEPFEARALEVPSGGDCGGLARLPRTRVAMLGDRVTLAIPPAEVQGMPHSIMAAEPSRELLGVSVPFYDQTEEGTHLREALVPRDGLALHVFYRASDPALFDAVDAIASSLRATP